MVLVKHLDVWCPRRSQGALSQMSSLPPDLAGETSSVTGPLTKLETSFNAYLHQRTSEPTSTWKWVRPVIAFGVDLISLYFACVWGSPRTLFAE